MRRQAKTSVSRARQRLRLTVGLTGLLVMLAGCGQKGPLAFTDPPAARATAVGTPASAATR